MRLYDFHCNRCGHDFEDLVRDVSDAKCPACAAGDVEKVLSAFAVGGKTGGEIASGGGSCGGGFCGGGGCGLS